MNSSLTTFMTKNTESITTFLKEQESCIGKLLEKTDALEKIIDILIRARDNEKKIYVMGNGGSASTASHFVSDLLKTAITKNEKRFFAISLTDNIPVMLAWSNDSSYDDIFVEQLKNSLSKDDVIIGFSGSGKSKNVIKAMEYGKENGAICIGITGMSGGDFPKICDTNFIVPSNDMLAIEAVHVILFHCIVYAIRNNGIPLFTYE
jgi:D-sedoheptulose 7-phosphate isomerase